MATPLKVRLRTAAAANPGLSALLGTTPFRWYDIQLVQGTGFPAVTVQQISNPQSYAFTGRLSTSSTRMQFTIWGEGADSSDADAVVDAIADFLTTFNGDGITGRVASPNFILNDRDMLYPQTQPPRWQRILDVMIFDNSTL